MLKVGLLWAGLIAGGRLMSHAHFWRVGDVRFARRCIGAVKPWLENVCFQEVATTICIADMRALTGLFRCWPIPLKNSWE